MRLEVVELMLTGRGGGLVSSKVILLVILGIRLRFKNSLSLYDGGDGFESLRSDVGLIVVTSSETLLTTAGPFVQSTVMAEFRLWFVKFSLAR